MWLRFVFASWYLYSNGELYKVSLEILLHDLCNFGIIFIISSLVKGMSEGNKHVHNILRLLDILLNFPFITSEMNRDY